MTVKVICANDFPLAVLPEDCTEEKARQLVNEFKRVFEAAQDESNRHLRIYIHMKDAIVVRGIAAEIQKQLMGAAKHLLA